MAIHNKTITNKWTYERSHKSLNLYSLVKYNKIYPITTSWKTLQEENLWQVDFYNLYFWNTLNKTYQGIFVWNRNNRLHTIYPNTNSLKTLQEESLWQVDFNNLYFWNTLNKTHQGIFVWNRNNRLHTSNTKHVHKERKETTHVRVGERSIHQHIKKISIMYVNNGHKTSVQE